MPAVDTIAQLTAFEGRGPGSEAERRAALWLRDELDGGGRSAELEQFSCRPNWALAQAWHVLLALAGGLAAVSQATAGGAMVLAALVFVVADALTGMSPGRLLTPPRRSQNVVSARADARSAGRVRLILTANYDAGWMGLVYRDRLRRAAARLRRATGGRGPGWAAWLTVVLCWLLVVAVARMQGSHGATISLLELPPTITLVLVLALLLELASSPIGPAGSDNGSGAAVAIAVARALDVAAPRALRVELVLAGAGEGGGIGLRRFLRARRRELNSANTIVLGIAACGAGSPRWWQSDGVLVPLTYHRRLRELCVGIARAEPQLAAAPHRGRGATPAFPARIGGLPAIAIGCLDERGIPPRSHQPADAPAAIDRAAVDQTVELALMLVDAIDAELAAMRAGGAATVTPA
jgi:hypothetical protein